MRLEDFRVAVRPGNGLVARFPSALLFVSGESWATDPIVARLVNECQVTSDDAPVAIRLRAIIAEADSDPPLAFSVVADSDDGLAIFVHGDAQVSMSGGQSVVVLGDQDVDAWGAQIDDRVSSLVMGRSDADTARTIGWLDLRDGVVPAGGAMLVSHAVVPTPLAPVATSPPAPSPLAATSPAPEAASPEDAAAHTSPALDSPDEVMVWGINCKEGHFNNPDARYCRMCGMHMVHQQKDLVLGPRPIVGYLVIDDGATYKLDTDYVVGREPTLGPSDVGGVRTLVVSDPEGTVSATHARVHLEEWDVVVTDQGSHFGTHVWTPGSDEWVRLEKGQSRTLQARCQVLLGRRRMVFEPVNRR